MITYTWYEDEWHDDITNRNDSPTFGTFNGIDPEIIEKSKRQVEQSFGKPWSEICEEIANAMLCD